MAPDDGDRPAPSADEATAAFSEAVGSLFTVVGRLAGGETGATEIRSDSGERRVLKWASDHDDIASRVEGADLAERLRVEAGWPVPQQQVVRADGRLLVAQQFMPGEPVRELTEDTVDDVLALHATRLGLAREEADERWGVDQIEILVSGGRGYCLHEPLRNHDRRTRRVVERIESIGRELDPAQLAGTDIVHADLHPGNLLQMNGRLAAVVDLDYTRVGDAAFDLVFLAVSSLAHPCDEATRRHLVEIGLDALDTPRRLAYVGNLALRLLDWPIRKNRTAEIEFWLPQIDRLLGDD